MTKKSLYSVLIAFGLGCPCAMSQQVVGVSVMAFNGDTIDTYSATELDYYADAYYDAYVEGYLFQNGGLIRSGSASSGSASNIAYGYMSAPLILSQVYQLESDHYLMAAFAYYDGGTAYYSNPYGFAFLPGGSSYPSGTPFLPGGGPVYVTVQYGYLGTTVVAGAAVLFDANNPSTLYSRIASLGGGGGSPANVEALVASSGVLNNTQAALTTDNLNVLGIGNLAGVGDGVDPTFEGYVNQWGYSFLAPSAPTANPGAVVIPYLIRVVVTAGGAVAAGAVVIASCLFMTGDHPAGWDPSRGPLCRAQQEADEATCRSRFPYGTNQGAKFKACIAHSWIRHTLCMKNQPVPPLQPEY